MEGFSKNQCIDAILKFDSSFLDMNLSRTEYPTAYELLDRIKLETENPKLGTIDLGVKLRYFYESFSRELFPGGIVLSDQAKNDFSEIANLANSSGILKSVNRLKRINF